MWTLSPPSTPAANPRIVAPLLCSETVSSTLGWSSPRVRSAPGIHSCSAATIVRFILANWRRWSLVLVLLQPRNNSIILGDSSYCSCNSSVIPSSLYWYPLSEQKEELVPSQLKSQKFDRDQEFESLLCHASRLQTSQRLRPTEIHGIQRPKEFPTLSSRRTLGENAGGRSITDRKYRNGEPRKRGSSFP